MKSYGDCVVTRIDDPIEGVQLRIERADPKILIAAQLLDVVAAKCLRIRGINRSVVYRVRKDGPGLYVGEWPD